MPRSSGGPCSLISTISRQPLATQGIGKLLLHPMSAGSVLRARCAMLMEVLYVQARFALVLIGR
eukprot:scaffold430465_cov17-Prasinocladus_malaysianus.AAC.1